ncbi:MAG TPA: nuclear transport factor 2 family protein [Rhizomicrobium sp.]|jgi:ketosteroid isomerase-like protein|nr:nuclear transport factor 2 family protein [Rhizomicrobium sp.]
MSHDAIRALAERFFDAIERGDIETVRAIYAPDAVIWHNTDNAGQPPEENLKTLANFIKHVPERRYADRRLDVFEGGFAQQHLLKAKLANGKDVSLAACLVCRVDGGRITRLDEYFDSAALAAWR